MNLLKKAFSLLDSFSSQTPAQRRESITKLDGLLRSAEERKHTALLALREIDQLRKQRAYMLIMSGSVTEGVKEIESLVTGYEETIEELHDEAAFQLAEAAIASFGRKRVSAGTGLALSALTHAGMAKRVSRNVLVALELLQKEQEKRSHRKGS